MKRRAKRASPRRPPYFDTDGEPWADADCKGCGGKADYYPGGGWKHRFAHCETRLAQIAARGAKKPSTGRHVFTAIAPEADPEGEHSKYPEVWRWCIRCGMLRLGGKYFEPGPRQKLVVVPLGDHRPPPCRGDRKRHAREGRGR